MKQIFFVREKYFGQWMRWTLRDKTYKDLLTTFAKEKLKNMAQKTGQC